MQKFFLISGAASGALSVLIGAFGAHGLKKHLTSIGKQDVFETAVKYQFYHVFALIITGILLYKFTDKLLVYAGYSFLAGTIIFSGSLYILCLTNVSKWGAVTPIGGVLFVVGWVLMLLACYNNG
ncbi:MAG: DUF423 domain-containing protein [Cytophagaceae bacterium]